MQWNTEKKCMQLFVNPELLVSFLIPEGFLRGKSKTFLPSLRKSWQDGHFWGLSHCEYLSRTLFAGRLCSILMLFPADSLKLCRSLNHAFCILEMEKWRLSLFELWGVLKQTNSNYASTTVLLFHLWHLQKLVGLMLTPPDSCTPVMTQNGNLCLERKWQLAETIKLHEKHLQTKESILPNSCNGFLQTLCCGSKWTVRSVGWILKAKQQKLWARKSMKLKKTRKKRTMNDGDAKRMVFLSYIELIIWRKQHSQRSFSLLQTLSRGVVGRKCDLRSAWWETRIRTTNQLQGLCPWMKQRRVPSIML